MIILKLFAISLLGFADYEIVDPHGTLKNGFHSGKDFAQAWSCPAQALVYAGTGICSVNCTSQYCTSQCGKVNQKSSLFAEECTADSVKIYGDQGLEFSINALDYNQYGQSWTYTFLRSLQQFFKTPIYQVVVENSFPMMVDLVSKGEKKTVFADMFSIKVFFAPNTMEYGVDLYVNPQADGLDQVLFFGRGKDFFFKRKGFFEHFR